MQAARKTEHYGSAAAIVIAVLYLKSMNPGPTLLVDNPQHI